jgi:hypothetical protein
MSAPKRRIRWRATGPAGVAHAFTTRVVAASCGARNQEERWDYPLRTRCVECLTREEERTKSKAG